MSGNRCLMCLHSARALARRLMANLECLSTLSGLCVMPPECQLFGTLGCHLCEVAEEELMPLVEHGLLVELVDIADSEALFEAYGLRIPVLRRVDTGAELNWPFDAEQVVAFLR
jgi:hypothetical protein